MQMMTPIARACRAARRWTAAAVVAGLTCVGASEARAAIAAVDFTLTTTGATTPGNWNNFAQGGTYRFQNQALPVTISPNLIDLNGGSTGVALTVPSLSGSSGPAGETFAGTIDGFPTTATQDAFFASGTTNLRFAGLTPGANYDLRFVSAITNSIPGQSNFTINGLTQTIDPEASPGVVLFRGVSASAGGEIDVAWSANGGAAFLNALTLNTAPKEQRTLVDFRGDNSGGTDAAGFVNIFDPSSSTRFQNLAKPFTIFGDMIDTDGLSTGTGLVLTSTAGNSGPAGETLTTPVAGFPIGASRDGLFLTNSGSGTGLNFDITGLETGVFYDLEFVVGVDHTRTGVTEITVGGSTLSLDHDGVNSHLLTFNDVVANANGIITFNWASQTDGQLAFLNALSITRTVAVPTPAALPAGLALMALTVLRRRRSNSAASRRV